MTCPPTQTLLLPTAPVDLMKAVAHYPAAYDEVFDAVHARLTAAGHATKLDLAALIAWKHVRNARWMKALFKLGPGEVEDATGAAFAPGLTDADRVSALAGLPGFGRGRAFTSVLLAAWDPNEFGVFDRIAGFEKWAKAMSASCSCDRASLPVYFDHMRQIALEMRAATGQPWTPRQVDMALLNL